MTKEIEAVETKESTDQPGRRRSNNSEEEHDEGKTGREENGDIETIGTQDIIPM